MLTHLAYKSLLSRKGSVLLAVLAICVSIFSLLAIEHIRHQVKENFGNTVSGVDLIVGSRTSSINLLLYSIFRIGNATNNIKWSTFQDISNNPKVAWTIPISLGDSHRGYRVMGTTTDYFQYYSYGRQNKLSIKTGKTFENVFDVVLGHDVAKKLNYRIGDKVVLAHGMANTSFSLHDDKPFQVVGILAATGTPVDKTLHVSLQGIEAIHIDWQHGTKRSTGTTTDKDHHDLTPKEITAFMLGLKSKMATFRIQRSINNYTKEPLSSILPGVALSELWQMMSAMENTLRLVSILMLISSLLGLSAMLLASIRERHREIVIMRTIGASPWFLFLLIEAEAILITVFASTISILLLFLCLFFMEDYLIDNFSLHLNTQILSNHNILLISIALCCSSIISLIPAFFAYTKASLHQTT